MCIAYLTTDEVNASVARTLAARCGLDLSLVHPRSAAPQDGARAIVFDADFLPEGHMAAMARLVGPGGRSPAVAVHGHNLDEAAVSRWQSAGVIVGGGLSVNLFEQLRALLTRPRVKTACRCDGQPIPAGRKC